MFVKWRRIQSAAVCFVYTKDESFSKHAIQSRFTAPRTRLNMGTASHPGTSK